MSSMPIPPQRPKLVTREIDDLWQWCLDREKAVTKLAGEARLDGYRCTVSKYDSEVQVKFEEADLAVQHPELAKAFRNAPFQALILDGIAVAVAEGKILSEIIWPPSRLESPAFQPFL